MKANESIPLITGANRGIGRSLVQAYLAHGAKKIYAAGRRRADLEAVVALDPKRIIPVVLDVTDAAQVRAAAEAAKDVNLLINNAGLASFGTILESPEENLRRDMEVNYFGLVRTSRAFAPVIEKNGGGAIANVLSVVSFASMPGIAGYNASKAAAWSATQALRADLAKRGVAVFAIFPGPIDTEMSKDFPMDKTPPADVAEAVIAGIATGTEDILPDPMSKQVYATWIKDPKGLEKQFGSM